MTAVHIPPRVIFSQPVRIDEIIGGCPEHTLDEIVREPRRQRSKISCYSHDVRPGHACAGGQVVVVLYDMDVRFTFRAVHVGAGSPQRENRQTGSADLNVFIEGGEVGDVVITVRGADRYHLGIGCRVIDLLHAIIAGRGDQNNTARLRKKQRIMDHGYLKVGPPTHVDNVGTVISGIDQT